jgi:hypothetical protein
MLQNLIPRWEKANEWNHRSRKEGIVQCGYTIEGCLKRNVLQMDGLLLNY